MVRIDSTAGLGGNGWQDSAGGVLDAWTARSRQDTEASVGDGGLRGEFQTRGVCSCSDSGGSGCWDECMCLMAGLG